MTMAIAKLPGLAANFQAKTAHQNPDDPTRRLALVSNFLDKNPTYTAFSHTFQDAVNKTVDKRVERIIHDYKPGIRNLRPRDIWEMAKAGISHGITAAGTCAFAVTYFVLPAVQDVLQGNWASAAGPLLGAGLLIAVSVYTVVDVIRSGVQYAPLAGKVRRETKAVVDEYARTF